MGVDFVSLFADAGKPLVTESGLQVCVQFHANYIDLDSQILYSDIAFATHDESMVGWVQSQLPVLKTPLNTVQLIQRRTLLMMIWGKAEAAHEFTLIGQAVFRLEDLIENASDNAITMSPIVLANKNDGVAKISLNFKTI